MDVTHVLRFYSFVPSGSYQGTTMVQCVAIGESPSFLISSRRRTLLPTTPTESDESDDAEKEESTSRTSTVKGKRRHAPPVDATRWSSRHKKGEKQAKAARRSDEPAQVTAAVNAARAAASEDARCIEERDRGGDGGRGGGRRGGMSQVTWTLDMASVSEISGPAGRPEAFPLAVPSTVVSATLASDLEMQLLQQHEHMYYSSEPGNHPGLRLEWQVAPEWLLEPLMGIPGVEDPSFWGEPSFWSGLGL